MSVNERLVDAPPDRVWAVLADVESYAEWVVGAKEIRGVEGRWPQPGATFHHTQGLGPLPLAKDTSTVLECDPGRRLKLEVRIRPWIVGHVTLTVERANGRSRVVMEEGLRAGLLRPVKPVLDRLFRPRNVESLRRLEEAARERR